MTNNFLPTISSGITNRIRQELPMTLAFVVALWCLSSLHGTTACSDVLVTPGASQDGSAMIGYNADDPSLYGVLYHYPATTDNEDGSMVQVYNWDTGVSIAYRACMLWD
jgi:hypothetical protein